MTKLRWGILATGWIADLFVQDLLDNGMTVTAVASRSIDKAAPPGRWLKHGAVSSQTLRRLGAMLRLPPLELSLL